MIEARKSHPSPTAPGTLRFPGLHRAGAVASDTPRREAPAPEAPRPVHDARALTEGAAQADILLDGMRYVLRITRQGKLILTK